MCTRGYESTLQLGTNIITCLLAVIAMKSLDSIPKVTVCIQCMCKKHILNRSTFNGVKLL